MVCYTGKCLSAFSTIRVWDDAHVEARQGYTLTGFLRAEPLLVYVLSRVTKVSDISALRRTPPKFVCISPIILL